MTSTCTRRLAAAFLATLCVTAAAPGCSQFESMTGSNPAQALADLPANMQKVAELTADISDWSAELSNFVTDPQLDQLSSYVSQAGDLLKSLQGAEDVPGVAPINNVLEQLATFPVADLYPMDTTERVEPVNNFTGIANTLENMANQYLMGPT